MRAKRVISYWPFGLMFDVGLWSVVQDLRPSVLASRRTERKTLAGLAGEGALDVAMSYSPGFLSFLGRLTGDDWSQVCDVQFAGLGAGLGAPSILVPLLPNWARGGVECRTQPHSGASATFALATLGTIFGPVEAFSCIFMFLHTLPVA